jgi:hypothetical protein
MGCFCGLFSELEALKSGDWSSSSVDCYVFGEASAGTLGLPLLKCCFEIDGSVVAPFGLMMSLLGGWLQQPRRGLTNDVANGFPVGLRGKNCTKDWSRPDSDQAWWWALLKSY